MLLQPVYNPQLFFFNFPVKYSYWMFGPWFLSFLPHTFGLYDVQRFVLWPHREETMLNTGRGHYLLVQHKRGAADRNSQALCISVYLQHYFYLAGGARKAVHFKAFRAFTRKSREDYRIYCSRRCHLAFFFFFTFVTLHVLHWLRSRLYPHFYYSPSIDRQILLRHYKKDGLDKEFARDPRTGADRQDFKLW